MIDINTTHIKPVRSYDDALQMAEVRNTCREYMTNDTSYIGVLRQTLWYFFTYKRSSALNGYLIQWAGLTVGYGMLNQKADKWWVTGGILPEFRGGHLGTTLFKTLTDLSPKPVWLEVRADNITAGILYVKLGYHIFDTYNGILVMKHD